MTERRKKIREDMMYYQKTLNEAKGMAKNFVTIEDKNYNKQKHLDMLEKLLDIEERFPWVMLDEYGTVSRAYLQTGDIEEANKYAAAYLWVSQKKGEQEKVLAAHQLLADICTYARDYDGMIMHCTLSKNDAEHEQVEIKNSEPIHIVSINLEKTGTPKSFKTISTMVMMNYNNEVHKLVHKAFEKIFQ